MDFLEILTTHQMDRLTGRLAWSSDTGLLLLSDSPPLSLHKNGELASGLHADLGATCKAKQKGLHVRHKKTTFAYETNWQDPNDRLRV